MEVISIMKFLSKLLNLLKKGSNKFPIKKKVLIENKIEVIECFSYEDCKDKILELKKRIKDSKFYDKQKKERILKELELLKKELKEEEQKKENMLHKTSKDFIISR